MPVENLKLLIVGSFNPGALENFYVRGFKKQGLQPETFDITTAYYSALNRSVINKAINKIATGVFFSPINKRLIEFTNKKQYDIILVVKGLTLYPSTIEALKKQTKVICCYNPDHPFHFFSEGSGNGHIKNSITHYNIYFSYAKKIVASLKDDYKVQSFLIPFGYDDDVKPPTRPVVDCSGKIAFIGSYDAERAKILVQLDGDSLTIYGDAKWKTRTLNKPALRKSVIAKALYGDDYTSAISTADGVLNFLRPQNIEEDSHNMRTFEVPGYAGLLIANRTSEQTEFFEEDKEAIFFDSIDELRDKIKFINNNKTTTEKMKQSAYKRASSSGYSYYHRSVTMINEIKKFL